MNTQFSPSCQHASALHEEHHECVTWTLQIWGEYETQTQHLPCLSKVVSTRQALEESVSRMQSLTPLLHFSLSVPRSLHCVKYSRNMTVAASLHAGIAIPFGYSCCVLTFSFSRLRVILPITGKDLLLKYRPEHGITLPQNHRKIPLPHGITFKSFSVMCDTSQWAQATLPVSLPIIPPTLHPSWCCCSAARSCLTLCDHIDCSMPGSSVLHSLLECAQIHVHWVSKAIQPSYPLPPTSPFAFNLSHHQGLFQWVNSLHQVAKVLELQFQHQSFQWIFRTDFL